MEYQNHARQLYVVKSLVDPGSESAVGSTSVNGTAQEMFFTQMGKGGLTRSDIVKFDNFSGAKAILGSTMANKLPFYKVELDSSVNNGDPIAGQDYIMNLNFFGYASLSDEYNYVKYGAVRATAGMDASTFYAKMAVSLHTNFKREVSQLIEVYLYNEDGDEFVVSDSIEELKTSIKNNTVVNDFGTITYINITVVPQEWVLGRMQDKPLQLDLTTSVVSFGGDEFCWGVVEKDFYNDTDNIYRKFADMEYFFMGSRGDQYRNINFPDSLVTEYMVDPTKFYNVIEINFAFAGEAENIQKSPKTITLLVEEASLDAKTNTNAVIADINEFLPISMSTL